MADEKALLRSIFNGQSLAVLALADLWEEQQDDYRAGLLRTRHGRWRKERADLVRFFEVRFGSIRTTAYLWIDGDRLTGRARALWDLDEIFVHYVHQLAHSWGLRLREKHLARAARPKGVRS